MTATLLALLLAQATPSPAPDRATQLAAQLADEAPSVRDDAMKALIELGPTATPALEALLTTHDDTAKDYATLILYIYSWDLPLPHRVTLAPTLLKLRMMPRMERIVSAMKLPGVQTDSILFAELSARAFDGATAKDFSPFLVGEIAGKPGLLGAIVRRRLARDPDALAALREWRSIKGLDKASWDLEAAAEIARHLETRGLGDLAGLSFASQLIYGAPASPAAAAALEDAGLPLEALLLYRRAAALDPDQTGPLRKAAELSAKLNCGAAQRALLNWLATRRIGEDTKREIAAQLAALNKASAGPGDDLAPCLRLHALGSLPVVGAAAAGDGLLYLSSSAGYFSTKTVSLSAFDLKTGAWRWAWSSPLSPNSEGGPHRDTPTLFPTDNGVIVPWEIRTNLPPGGGSLGLSAMRRVFTRVDRDGRTAWSREYDLDLGGRVAALDLDFLGVSVHHQQGRSVVISAADGQAVRSTAERGRMSMGPGKRLLVVSESVPPELAVHDLGENRVLWRKHLRDLNRMSGDCVGFLDADAIWLRAGRSVWKIDAGNGDMKWEHEVAADEGVVGLTARDGKAYALLHENNSSWKVACLSGTDGSELWSASCPFSDADRMDMGWMMEGVALRWAGDLLLFGGRVADIKAKTVEGLVLREPDPRSAHDPALAPRLVAGDRLYYLMPGFIGVVNAKPERVDPAKLAAVAAGARAKNLPTAEALEALLKDIDPFRREKK